MASRGVAPLDLGRTRGRPDRRDALERVPGRQDGRPSDASTIRLAIVAAEDHRVLYDEPTLRSEPTSCSRTASSSASEGNRMGRYETDPLARVGTVAGAAGGLDAAVAEP